MTDGRPVWAGRLHRGRPHRRTALQPSRRQLVARPSHRGRRPRVSGLRTHQGKPAAADQPADGSEERSEPARSAGPGGDPSARTCRSVSVRTQLQGVQNDLANRRCPINPPPTPSGEAMCLVPGRQHRGLRPRHQRRPTVLGRRLHRRRQHRRAVLLPRRRQLVARHHPERSAHLVARRQHLRLRPRHQRRPTLLDRRLHRRRQRPTCCSTSPATTTGGSAPAGRSAHLVASSATPPVRPRHQRRPTLLDRRLHRRRKHRHAVLLPRRRQLVARHHAKAVSSPGRSSATPPGSATRSTTADPFWVGDFTGGGSTDILFYFPGDDNWWLGTIQDVPSEARGVRRPAG